LGRFARYQKIKALHSKLLDSTTTLLFAVETGFKTGISLKALLCLVCCLFISKSLMARPCLMRYKRIFVTVFFSLVLVFQMVISELCVRIRQRYSWFTHHHDIAPGFFKI